MEEQVEKADDVKRIAEAPCEPLDEDVVSAGRVWLKCVGWRSWSVWTAMTAVEQGQATSMHGASVAAAASGLGSSVATRGGG